MGRRRKEPGISDILLASPWWVSVLLGVGAYIGLHAIIPAMLAANPFLRGIAMVGREMAWIPAVMFCFLGLLSYIKTRSTAQAGSEVPRPSSPRQSSRRPSSRERGGSSHAASQAPLAPPAPAAGIAATPGPAPSAPPQIHGWSLVALGVLDWKRFELLCVAYYEQLGFTVTTVPHGADGGIDATLYKQGMDQPMALVQCKAWQTAVKVEPVRALGGVMHQHKIKRGVFWSLSGYTGEAKKYAAEAGIQLLDGAGILERIQKLDPAQQAGLLKQAFDGDYRTPTCAACGVKLVRRNGPRGPFWGCNNYPRCKVKMKLAA